MAIIGAVDESHRASAVVKLGYDLAETYDEPFIPLHVIPESDYQAHRESIQGISGFGEFTISQEEESAKEFARRFTYEALEEIDSNRVQPRGRVGDPASTIIAEANNLNPRFLVICGKRRSPVGKALFGSVAQEVLLGVSCPVVTQFHE